MHMIFEIKTSTLPDSFQRILQIYLSRQAAEPPIFRADIAKLLPLEEGLLKPRCAPYTSHPPSPPLLARSEALPE